MRGEETGGEEDKRFEQRIGVRRKKRRWQEEERTYTVPTPTSHPWNNISKKSAVKALNISARSSTWSYKTLPICLLFKATCSCIDMNVWIMQRSISFSMQNVHTMSYMYSMNYIMLLCKIQLRAISHLCIVHIYACDRTISKSKVYSMALTDTIEIDEFRCTGCMMS